jgi:ABC-type dipeptide/oligopeptide/nickel transport system permease subunit
MRRAEIPMSTSAVTTTPAAVEPIFNTKPRGLWGTAMRRLFHRRSAIIGMIILGGLIFIAIFAPCWPPTTRVQAQIGLADVQKRSAPCIHLFGCPADQPEFFFGTDGNVRDLYSRVLYGARLSLMVGILSVGFAIAIGAFIGAVSAYVGGYTDNLLMGLMDILLAFPSLILAIAIVTVLGPGLLNTLLAIGIVSIPVYARIMRSSVLAIKQQDYVLAGQSIGSKSSRILHAEYPAQRADAAGRARHAGHRRRHPRRGRALLSRSGRTAADAGMGVDDRPGAQPGLHARRTSSSSPASR